MLAYRCTSQATPASTLGGLAFLLMASEPPEEGAAMLQYFGQRHTGMLGMPLQLQGLHAAIRRTLHEPRHQGQSWIVGRTQQTCPANNVTISDC